MAEERILAKIKKLLALATSNNESEAAAAAAKAQTMLIQYNISESELNEFSLEKEEKVIEIRTKGKNNRNGSRWYDSLAGIVATSNLCKILISGSGIIWIGKPTNLEVSQYIFENLVRELTKFCEDAWAEYSQPIFGKQVHGKTWKNNFFHGANAVIRERLRANLAQISSRDIATNALVTRNEQELNEYINNAYKYLRNVPTRYSFARDAYEQGKSAGRSVNFTSGIGAGGSTGPKLIGG